MVSGQPGLGKTAFAVHAAHALTPHFPHGQYAIDLRGMDPRPTPPRDALARLLRALGTADNDERRSPTPPTAPATGRRRALRSRGHCAVRPPERPAARELLAS
ncbi:hypothetical protein ACFV9E_27705 [Streptomyces sp. NPDC059835]|uniref:hypothetical protein n=1 Tax=Streptomyces sp. NPDC059835 TaxID=3346967 RepID=UPI00365F5196